MFEDVQERVLRVVAARVHVPVESLSPATTFDEIHLDSLDRLNLLFDVEAEFDIHIDDEQAMPINTIGALIEGVTTLIGAETEPSPAN